jgi:hypothetical protein
VWQVSIDRFKVSLGPFAKTRKNVDGFCHNLILSNAMNECAHQLIKIEKEYHEAVLKDDELLMQQKKLEMQAYQSSLHLTAYMYDEVDEIST